MSVATQDIRAMSDEQLREAWAAGEDASALAEARRRDQADKAARLREQLRDEWLMAAHEQMLAAEAECCGNLLSREGLANGPDDPFSLWYGREEVARKYASWELNDFWDQHPRVTIGEYVRRARVANRLAREDTATGEVAHDEGLAANDTRSVRQDCEAAAAEPVRCGQSGEPDGPVQRRAGGRVRVEGEPMGILHEGVRAAEHLAVGVARADERLRQARNTSERLAEFEAARLTGGRGTVVVPAAQAPVKPPTEPVDGAWVLNLADMWMGRHVHMSDAARHACVLYVAAQHFRLSDESRRLAWPRFGRIMLVARQPGSGKTTAMIIMGYMSAPFFFGIDANPTSRGLAHSINQEHAAIYIDEAHRLFGPKGTKKADVVTILTTGYEKNGTTLDGRGGKANRIKTYAPVVMAGKDILLTSAAEEIGDLIDRCAAVIKMERPPEGVELAEVTDETEEHGGRIAEKLAQWAAQEMADTGRFREAFTTACAAAKEDGLTGRAKDIWVPMLATAWLASPVHLVAARDAAIEFQLNRPVPQEEAIDPLADLEASLTGGGEIAGWG